MDDADKKAIEQRKALLHERRAKLLEVLRAEPALKPQEQAAIVYTLAIEPDIAPHIPGVIETSLRQQFEGAAHICQCPTCKAQRAQA